MFKRLRDFWFGEFAVRWYKTFREVARVIHAKTLGFYEVPSWSYGQETAKNHQKSPFLRGCVIFGLVNLWWGDIELSGKLQGSSMRKHHVSIKSQAGVMAKKLRKITILKRLRDFWFGEFVVRYYRTIWEVTRVIHAKTPRLYQVPSWSYGQETAQNHHF